MIKFKYLSAAALCLTLGSLQFSPARADSVLYDGSGFVVGTQSFTDTFNVAGPGTLTVTLSNIAWPQPLQDLNFLLSSSNGIMGPESSAGSYAFAVAAGGNVFLQWFATAQGPLDAGVYALKVDFRPSAVPVPLPASVLLLLSGLGMAWVSQRTMRSTAKVQTA